MGHGFAIGTADGAFLRDVMGAATAAGLGEDLHVRRRIEAEVDPSPTGQDVVGIVPGDSDEHVIVNTRTDGWFDVAAARRDDLDPPAG